MKKSNRGFTLVETLIVSAFIIGILIFLFSQFTKLKKSYDASFDNNTIPALYKARNINRYLYSVEGPEFITKLEESENGYLEITDCSNSYISKVSYCKKLFEELEVKHVFVTKEAIFKYEFQYYLKENTNTKYSEKLYRFVKNLSVYNDNYDGYRIIVEFKDDGFATVGLNH